MRKTFPPRPRSPYILVSTHPMKSVVARISLCALLTFLALATHAEVKSLKVDATGKLLVNDQPTKIWGLRCAGAAATDATTAQLVATLPELKENGCNMILVCYQGSTGLSLKTFSADGASVEDSAVRDRVRKIIEAANAKEMLVVVSLFFPRKMGVGGQDPRLASRDAYLSAVKTAAEELKRHKNAILCVADQPLASAFVGTPMKFNAADIVECLGAAASVAPELLRGGGNASHETNLTVAKSDVATVIFHAENGINPPSFPQKKPIIHTGYLGASESAGKNPQGFYVPQAKQPFSDILDRYTDASTAHFLAHFPAWTEGGMDLKTNRFDIGGQGTIKDPGLAWYFDALRRRAKKKPAGQEAPVKPGKSIFD